MESKHFIPIEVVSSIQDGGMLRFVVGDSVRVLARMGDTYYALDGICTHQHAELEGGEIEADTLWCPLHASGFDIRTGEPSSPPAMRALETYAVDVQADGVYVSVQPASD